VICAECRANPGPVPQAGVALRGPPAANRLVTSTVLLSVCHSNATRPKEVCGFMFGKRSWRGAPLRNRTVDLLLTMDHRRLLKAPQRLWAGRTLAHASGDEPRPAPTGCVCPPTCPLNDLRLTQLGRLQAPTSPRSGSSAGPSSAASSTTTSGPHRNRGQDWRARVLRPRHEPGLGWRCTC